MHDTLGINCRYARVVGLPDGLDVVREGAFQNGNMQIVAFPASVRRICRVAFAGCKCLRKLIFCEGSLLEVVESRAFSGTDLRNVVFPASASVSADVFAGNMQ